MQAIRLIAILGGSGSGKSRLGLELAKKLNCEIFSLDSLCIYQDIDIASAKPTPQELQDIHHYAINFLSPAEHNHAPLFRDLLQDAIASTLQKGHHTLLIIGGSSFYLKSILHGLSPLPKLTSEQSAQIQEQIASLPSALDFLLQLEKTLPFSHQDTYRIHKFLEIYFATGLPPSIYFKENPKIPFAYSIEKYALTLPKEILKEKISQRTAHMFERGILDESWALLQHYGDQIQPFNSIGLKECKQYFQGQIQKEALPTLINTHTLQLAKRQNTFNRTQFGPPASLQELSSPQEYAKKHIVWGEYKELLEFF